MLSPKKKIRIHFVFQDIYLHICRITLEIEYYQKSILLNIRFHIYFWKAHINQKLFWSKDWIKVFTNNKKTKKVYF